MPKGYKNPDYTNQEFNYLTVLHQENELCSDRRRNYWHCRCVCGKEVRRRADAIISGKTTSCGCKHSNRHKIGKLSPLWTGCGDIAGWYLAALKASAKKRNIEFNLTIEYIWDLFKKQEGICALSGLPIKFHCGSSRHNRMNQTASLDRIDSNLGYVEENVYWVHKVVNLMKNHFESEVFIHTCNAIAKKHPREVNEDIINKAKGTRNATTKRQSLTLS